MCYLFVIFLLIKSVLFIMEVITSELTNEKISNRCLKQLENLYEETRKFIKKRFYKKAFVQLDRFYI
jgi:hypothetical protein